MPHQKSKQEDSEPRAASPVPQNQDDELEMADDDEDFDDDDDLSDDEDVDEEIDVEEA
jgi:hypothetical protein